MIRNTGQSANSSDSFDLSLAKKVHVSFIIPHMGRQEMLLQTLNSIQALETKSLNIEILVVTKTHEVIEMLRDFTANDSCNVIFADLHATIAYQRNLGAKFANGCYLAFLDADIQLEENWLSKLVPILMENKDIKLVSAVQKCNPNANQLVKLRTVLSNAKTDCDVNFLPGRNLLLSQKTFYKVQGFPEHLITCEDYLFSQKVSRLGRLFYSNSSSYIHLGEDQEYWSMLKKEIWRGSSNFSSLKGRRVPLYEFPSIFVPPIFTLSLLLSVSFLLIEMFQYALFLFIIAFSILFVYCARLYSLGKGEIKLRTVITFYALYFPARTVGTLIGALKKL